MLLQTTAKQIVDKNYYFFNPENMPSKVTGQLLHLLPTQAQTEGFEILKRPTNSVLCLRRDSGKVSSYIETQL